MDSIMPQGIKLPKELQAILDPDLIKQLPVFSLIKSDPVAITLAFIPNVGLVYLVKVLHNCSQVGFVTPGEP